MNLEKSLIEYNIIIQLYGLLFLFSQKLSAFINKKIDNTYHISHTKLLILKQRKDI